MNTNKARIKAKAVNREGGRAYALSDQAALATLVLTSFNEDQFYRAADEARAELTNLVEKVPGEFALKLAVLARRDYHMRSLPQILAATAVQTHAGTPNLRRAIAAVCERADDMAGIVSYYTATFGKEKLPAALYHGVKAAFDKFDSHQLGKYGLTGREWTMIDLIRMVRPVPTERNAEALASFVKHGKYTVATWETELSQAGQNAAEGETPDAVKAAAWKALIDADKLGYMAMLRNLRTIGALCDEYTIGTVAARLVEPERVKRSKQLPFRFLSAQRELLKADAPKVLIAAVSRALDIACDNVPALAGKTAVCVDLSGSMSGALSRNGTVTMKEVAALFGAVLAKASNADVYGFATTATRYSFNPRDTAQTVTDGLLQLSQRLGGGTSFSAALDALSKGYDRLIFLTDCQGWQGVANDDAGSQLDAHRKRFGDDPFVYCVDLAGYGTSKFAQPKYVQIAGFSEKVFDLIALNEIGPKALIDQIEAVDLATV